MSRSSAITVMQSLSAPSPGKPISNPYTRLLVGSMKPERVKIAYFRWKGFLTDDFDVLHVHWPEVFVRHSNKLVHVAKCFAFLVFLIRIRLQKKAVVRTVHNLKPHEDGTWLERRVLTQLDKQTHVRIALNEATPNAEGTLQVLVPHGHYRDWYKQPRHELIVKGRLLAFGYIRAYKGIDALVKSFRHIDDPTLTLHVAGRADNDSTASFLREHSEQDPRISLDIRFVPDEDLATAIAEAEAVVLPYREVHNSGVALLALSLNRPVIMRRSAAAELMQNEFGAEWVTLFDGELTADALQGAIEATRDGERAERVDMSSREWPLLAEKTADAYMLAIRAVR